MAQRNYSRLEAEDLCSDIAPNAYTSKFVRGPDTPTSIRVVETVADALGTEPNELGPLYETVDPDALDLLFESPRRFTSGCVTFTFEGCNVTVDADGWIAVSPETDDEE
jgi:hypothetical protein